MMPGVSLGWLGAMMNPAAYERSLEGLPGFTTQPIAASASPSAGTLLGCAVRPASAGASLTLSWSRTHGHRPFALPVLFLVVEGHALP
jgi:hypothetical protein